eukprot:6185307-Pleurochrysis_carterae.AAC.1
MKIVASKKSRRQLQSYVRLVAARSGTDSKHVKNPLTSVACYYWHSGGILGHAEWLHRLIGHNTMTLGVAVDRASHVCL